jgi:hypothetical protein
LKGCPAVNQSESPAACGSGRKGAGKVKRQPKRKEGRLEGKETARGSAQGPGRKEDKKGAGEGVGRKRDRPARELGRQQTRPAGKQSQGIKQGNIMKKKRLKKRVFCWKGWCTVDVWVVFGEYL